MKARRLKPKGTAASHTQIANTEIRPRGRARPSQQKENDMIEQTPEQQAEMLDLLRRTHEWIDGMQAAGLAENAIVTAMQAALVERLLRAGGVAKAAEWLQGQADMVHKIGPMMLAEIRAQGH